MQLLHSQAIGSSRHLAMKVQVEGDSMRSFFNARTCVSAVVLGMVLFVFNQQSSAQDVNASLEGTVQDPTGAAVPGAKMTLTNEATGAQLNFATDAAGEYNFRNLSPGIYDLAVTSSSFESFVRKGIELAVNQNARIPVALTLGNASQTVTVSADASLINYETPTRSLGVAPEKIQNLPLVISGAPPILSDGCNFFAWRDHRGRRQCL